MDQQEAEELLRKKWPGAEEALVKLMNDLKSQCGSPWMAAKIKVDGVQAFAENVADSLGRSLVKLDHAVLADLAAHAMAPIILKLIVEVCKQNKKGEFDANDR